MIVRIYRLKWSIVRENSQLAKAGISYRRYSKPRTTDPDFVRRVADTIAAKKAKQKNTFLKYLSKLGRISAATVKTGIDKSIYYNWRESDPKFREDAADAIARASKKGKPTTTLADQQRFLKAFKRTGRVYAASAKARISLDRYHYWRRTDPDFSRQVAETKSKVTP